MDVVGRLGEAGEGPEKLEDFEKCIADVVVECCLSFFGEAAGKEVVTARVDGRCTEAAGWALIWGGKGEPKLPLEE